MQAARGVASDLYSGLERASWYSSCLVPHYNDACQELKAEEIRTVYSVQSIFRYHDVLGHMLQLYFEMVYDDIKNGNPKGGARGLAKTGANVASHLAVTKATRNATTYAVAQLLVQSEFLSKAVVEKLAGKISFAVVAIQFFGLEQKAALAARALKSLDSQYYWILYQAKLEMLYYFIEPILADIIKRVKSGLYFNFEDLAEDLRERYGV
ncbi:hypothetical protein SIL08_03400 [Scandinavium sp. V105_16]|uniref:Uncharacterized protein n=1 Tax=Scandinavium lactucae TaxID=3095028 RepID=A0AAJ2RYJ7_9ENTR|nr:MULTISPECIES: hypothetical protein [unclassified Scandinavium]MDX6019334.1 hypothetical protein [Scandinavium sp. V105_16]MDX6030510.1 hypothetical protein [Scandinavium sp. V105_12]